MKRAPLALSLLLVGCQGSADIFSPDESHPVLVGEKPMPPPPPPPMGATRSEPAQGPLAFLTGPEGFHPLTLDRAIAVSTKANDETKVSLPVTRSASAVWLGVRAEAEATVTIAGRTVTVGPSLPTAWVPAPLEARQVALTTTADAALTLRTAGVFDQSGAGLVTGEETARTQTITASTPTPLELGTAAPDDTWGAWVQVTATATQGDGLVELGPCGSTEPLERIQVTAGQSRSALVPTSRGPTCAFSSAPMSLSLRPIARWRRFERSGFRVSAPLTVLDTAKAIGWSGVPLVGQALEVDLSKLTALAGTPRLALWLEGTSLSAGTCGALEPLLPGARLVFHDPAQPFCVASGAEAAVRVSVVGVVVPGFPERAQCAPVPAPAACAATDLLGRLNCVPGVVATQMGSRIRLSITQPVDHARPTGETFTQRVLLTPGPAGAPVVLATTGYSLFGAQTDLAATLGATELEVEHRWFGESKPVPADFRHLNIVQSAHDSHRLVELLRPVLEGPWYSTGHSKGGMTALFHRRFFPCDVDGTVPYVTPVSYGLKDARYGPWMQNVIGGAARAECRQAFRDIDREMISKQASIVPTLQGTYTKVGSALNALWSVAGSVSWGLFQYGDDVQACPQIVDAVKDPPTLEQLAQQLSNRAEGESDQGLLQMRQHALFAYVYQCTNELGDPGVQRDHLNDLGPVPMLKDATVLALDDLPVPAFETRAMPDVQAWLRAKGTRFVFIYGGNDPWTGGQLELGADPDSAKLVVPGANHGVGVDELPAAEKLRFNQVLDRWRGGTTPGFRPARPWRDGRPMFRDVMRSVPL